MAHNRYFEDEKIESFNPHLIRRLLGYLKPYKKQVVISLLLMSVAALANLMGPYLTKIVIDNYISKGNLKGLFWISFSYLLLLLINGLCVRYRVLIMNKAGQKVIKNLRKELFEHIQKLSFNYFDSRPAGKIIVRVMNNVNSLQFMLENGIINIVIDFFTLIFILAIMFKMHAQLTLISLSISPILVLTIFLMKKRIRINWQSVQKKNSNLNAYIHESITGMKVTQAFVREEKNSRIFYDLLQRYKKSWMAAVMISHSVFPVVLIINVASVILVYLNGINYLHKDLITLGTLIALLQYVWRVWQPVINMSNFYNQILIANSAAERVFEVLDTEPDIVNTPGASNLPTIKGKIEFKNVTFSYITGEEILKKMNFIIEPGETIALVGPTGAGKSTIINLLTRFYDIDKGKILIDGIDTMCVTLSSLRKQIGIMMQDTFIFSGSIMDNIRYGNLEASDQEVIEAAKTVYAHDFINEMENGYQTEVNERGSRLSVGQRQLISFARTILSNPGILILDEATSSIDTQTEILIQKATAAVLEGRTSFVIAHRLSTIRNADRIMFINNGEIIEIGNHEQLIHRKGAYYQLYKAQFNNVV
jgi:ATP-binding cassette, subfamily B, multidrug efflux pump